MDRTHHLEHASEHADPPPFWCSRYGMGLLFLGAIAAYFWLQKNGCQY